MTQTNGEIAYETILNETQTYNNERRYRLTSNPDMVVALDNLEETSHFIGNLMAKQDQVATDLSFLMPHLIPLQNPAPEYYGD